jgi:hypothetical protein
MSTHNSTTQWHCCNNNTSQRAGRWDDGGISVAQAGEVAAGGVTLLAIPPVPTRTKLQLHIPRRTGIDGGNEEMKDDVL